MERTEWFKKAIVYQIYPFSYMDSNNDGMGDIKGIISKLDYIKELGVNAIWFSPLYVSPCKDYGYDVADYRNIDPKFGTNEDFFELVKECHKRGIKVIMDMVLNHTSNEHEWFKEAISNPDSKYRNYYIIRKGIKRRKRLLPPSNWTSTFTGPAWERIEGTDDFYLHLFTKEQPDLNWENEEVRNEIYSILNYWMDNGVDGFRFDVFNLFSKKSLKSDSIFSFSKGAKYYIDGPRIHEFLKEMNEKSLSLYDSYTVGESYNPRKGEDLKYVDKNNKELDSIFNFAHIASDSIMGAKFLPKKFNMMQYKNGFFNPQLDYYNNNGWSTLVLENHDNPRSVSRFGFDKNYRYEVATMLPIVTYLAFGIPYIYQGQEIGMTNCEFDSIDEMKDPVSHFVYNLMRKLGFSKKLAFKNISYGARDHARCPMQWDASTNAGFNKGATPWMKVSPNYKEINVKSDFESNKSIYKFYQKVLKLKNSSDCLIDGEIKEYSHSNKNVIAYSRSNDKESYFIVGSFKNKTVKYKLPKEVLEYTSILSNYDNIKIENGVLTLDKYQAVVLKK